MITVAFFAGALIAVFGGDGWSVGMQQARQHESSEEQHDFISEHTELLETVRGYLNSTNRSVASRISVLQAIDQWMREDPVDCSNSLYRLGAFGLAPEGLLDEALRAGELEPSIVLGKATSTSAPHSRDHLISYALTEAIKRNPQSALELFGAVPPHLQRVLGDKLGQALGNVATAESMTELIHHRNGGARVIQSALSAWAKSQPVSVLQFLNGFEEADLRSKGFAKQNLLGTIEASVDPSTLLDYYDGLPPSSTRTRGLEEARSSLLAKSPQRWDELTSGATSVVELTNLARSAAIKVAGTNPSDADPLLNRISGIAARSGAAKQVAQRFLSVNGRDSQRSVAWLKTITDPVALNAVIAEMRFQGMPVEEMLARTKL